MFLLQTHQNLASMHGIPFFGGQRNDASRYPRTDFNLFLRVNPAVTGHFLGNVAPKDGFGVHFGQMFFLRQGAGNGKADGKYNNEPDE